jgi:hypothetical protein
MRKNNEAILEAIQELGKKGRKRLSFNQRWLRGTNVQNSMSCLRAWLPGIFVT